MVRSKIIRVHPIFYDALRQMKEDLEKLEEEMFSDTELTRRIGLRIKRRRNNFTRNRRFIVHS